MEPEFNDVIFKYDMDREAVCVGVERPVGHLKFMNITVGLFGKLPNKFQRWMMKKCFGFEIEECKDERQ